MPTEAIVLFCAIGWLFIGSLPMVERFTAEFPDRARDFIADLYCWAEGNWYL